MNSANLAAQLNASKNSATTEQLQLFSKDGKARLLQ